ncbi:hypothetical protein [Actinocrispum sp. NPDC049592]|uniref:hypothetical protein n=1 Tax=Actinocrispum sp. NPDC049592 TaxID=3154835 RepID=UPI0034353528
MGKVNWTVVAISAGVTLGASVAVLSTSGSDVPEAGGQIIVPQPQPVLAGETAEVPAPEVDVPDQPVPPAPPSVITVNLPVRPSGYTATPPMPPRPAPPPAVRVNAAVNVNPGNLIRNTTTTTNEFVNRIIGMSPMPGFGWFGPTVNVPVRTTFNTQLSRQPQSWLSAQSSLASQSSLVSQPSVSSRSSMSLPAMSAMSASSSKVSTGVGRHRAIDRGCRGGRHHRH